MSQTKKDSFKEAATNVAIGYTVSIFSQSIIYPLFDIQVGLGKNMLMAFCFTLISLLRNYCVRRWFNKKVVA